MRLLMVAQDFPPATGGIQTYAAELAERLQHRVQAFEVLCPGDHRSDRRVARGYAVQRVPGGPELFPAASAGFIAERVLRRGFDVAFHTQWQSLPASALLRSSRKLRRLAVAAHGKELLLRPLLATPRLQALYDAARVRLLESADVVLPVSRFTASLLPQTERVRARLQVVSNGVASQRLSRLDRAAFRARHRLEQARVLLTVARLVPRKGIDSVLRCLPALCAQLADLHYVVAGDGPDAARLAALAEQLGVASRVHFLGRVEDAELGSCYAGCDAFVLATRAEPDSVEGFGLVLLEAAACGRAVVTTDAGGTAEAVRAEITGLVVPANDETALEAALLRVLGDATLAASLGAAGREHALHAGSWDRVADDVYRALAGTALG
jgi:phosphatidylinositol alpha-1,6-mannosyltransferase